MAQGDERLAARVEDDRDGAALGDGRQPQLEEAFFLCVERPRGEERRGQDDEERARAPDVAGHGAS